MNLKLVQWLIQHREVLLAVLAVAKKFDRSSAYIKKWEIVDEIARIVIPVFESEGTFLGPLTDDVMSLDEDAVGAFALGAEVQALGIDWQALVQVVIPLLIAILKAIADDE